MSENCRLIKSDATYLLYTLTSTNTSLTSSSVDLTTLLNSNTATTEWQVSDDCSKIMGKKFVYTTISSAMTLIPNLNVSWISFDSSLTYGIASGQIWKFNTPDNTYSTIYSSLNTNFSTGSIIKSYSNRIIVYTIGTSNVLLDVFVDNSNTLTKITNTTLSYTFTSSPKVSLSSKLTKILIYGVSSGSLKPYLFFADYNLKSIQSLTFPTETVFDPLNYLALV